MINPITRVEQMLREDLRELARSLSDLEDKEQVKPHRVSTVAQDYKGRDPMKSRVFVISVMPNGYVAKVPCTLGQYFERTNQ